MLYISACVIISSAFNLEALCRNVIALRKSPSDVYNSADSAWKYKVFLDYGPRKLNNFWVMDFFLRTFIQKNISTWFHFKQFIKSEWEGFCKFNFSCIATNNFFDYVRVPINYPFENFSSYIM